MDISDREGDIPMKWGAYLTRQLFRASARKVFWAKWTRLNAPMDEKGRMSRRNRRSIAFELARKFRLEPKVG